MRRSRQATANWIVNDIMGLARSRSLAMDELPLSPVQIRDLVSLVKSGKLTGRAAKELLPQIEAGESVGAAAQRLNLVALDDAGAVLDAARTAIANNPAVVEDYRNGKTAAIGRLIGETMRGTGRTGEARPGA